MGKTIRSPHENLLPHGSRQARGMGERDRGGRSIDDSSEPHCETDDPGQCPDDKWRVPPTAARGLRHPLESIQFFPNNVFRVFCRLQERELRGILKVSYGSRAKRFPTTSIS